MKKLTAPLSREDALSLRAGEHILLSGTVYTARDAAHLRMLDLLAEGKPLPIDLEGQVIYYAGPTPTPEGRPVGSIGPTTSVRMDAMTPSSKWQFPLTRPRSRPLLSRSSASRSLRSTP